MIKCLVGCHSWFTIWLRVDDAISAGLPESAVKDKKGRVLLRCCRGCGRVKLAKEAKEMDVKSCIKCGRDMLRKPAKIGLPEHYVCTSCGHTESATVAIEGNEGRRGAGKRTLVD